MDPLDYVPNPTDPGPAEHEAAMICEWCHESAAVCNACGSEGWIDGKLLESGRIPGTPSEPEGGWVRYEAQCCDCGAWQEFQDSAP